MAELDTLFALAELAIGMAGFSAIVVLFKRGDSGRWLRVHADRFNGMVLHAMAAGLFCVLPAAVGALGVDAPAVWRTCSGILAVQIALHAGLVLTLATTPRTTQVTISLSALLAVGFQLANWVDLGVPRGFAPYLVGVLWHLIHAGVLFLLLIWVRNEDVERA